jgi:hypothetical protein
MTLSRLEALADYGFGAVRPEELGGLAIECRENCENTGDGRYCILADLFSAVNDWWSEHDESGGVPEYIVRDLENVLRMHLLPVVRSDNPAEAAMLATMLRREVDSKLIGPSEWRT